MILVYSTLRTDLFESGEKTSDVKMPFVKKLLRWVKKYEKFGAFAEIEETTENHYRVDIYCPKIYVDKLGNMAIKPKALLRSSSNHQ